MSDLEETGRVSMGLTPLDSMGTCNHMHTNRQTPPPHTHTHIQTRHRHPHRGREREEQREGERNKNKYFLKTNKTKTKNQWPWRPCLRELTTAVSNGHVYPFLVLHSHPHTGTVAALASEASLCRRQQLLQRAKKK